MTASGTLIIRIKKAGAAERSTAGGDYVRSPGGLFLLIQNNISCRHFKWMPDGIQKFSFHQDGRRNTYCIYKLIHRGNPSDLILQVLGSMRIKYMCGCLIHFPDDSGKFRNDEFLNHIYNCLILNRRVYRNSSAIGIIFSDNIPFLDHFGNGFKVIFAESHLFTPGAL